MNEEQLSGLSKNGLLTLAIHTHNHYDLSQQKKQIQRKEIVTSKNFLHKNFNVENRYFSYPFGRYNRETIQLVRELELTACFTTEAVPVNKESNKFLLGRHQAFNWNEITFKKQLDGWLATAAGNLI